MRILHRRASLLLIGAALTGCITNSTHSTRPNRERPADSGKPAREVSGSDADGKPFQLSDYRGKVVLLDFWASW